ncbi:MAG: hypothetical protein U5Q16_12895 [Gammaproteobacteria bacterium]|nr:hypothetical protein [Gammaproteobacteria bacterium]
MKLPGLQHYAANAAQRYQGLGLRERILVAAALLAVTWAVWSFAAGQPLGAYRQAQADAVALLEQRVQAARAEAERLQAAGGEDPDARLLRERERLEQRLQAMNLSLGTLLNRFVDPQTMPALVEDMIRGHEGVKLLRMQSLPAQAMELGLEPDAAVSLEQDAPQQIFRHPLQLEFEGSYFNVVSYLRELESGPWGLGWRSLRYEVHDYPRARVILQVETLSRDKSWIGV